MGKQVVRTSLLLLLIINVLYSTHFQSLQTFITPTNTIIFDDVKFALLDNVPPLTNDRGCQIEALDKPPEDSEWKLADPTNPIHRKAVGTIHWGTSCVVMDGGMSLSTTTLEVCKYSDALIEEYGMWKVNGCDQRILLYSNVTANSAEFIPCYNFKGSDCSNWNSDSVTVIAGDGVMAVTVPDIGGGSFEQSVHITGNYSLTLQSGFEFSIKSNCKGCIMDPYTLSVEFIYANDSDIISLTWGEAFEEYYTNSFSFIPSFQIETVRLLFDFPRLSSGSAHFTALNMRSLGGLLNNGEIEGGEFDKIDNWVQLSSGYMPDLPRAKPSTSTLPFGSILMTNSFEQEININAAYQIVNFEYSDQIRSFYVGGYSKAIGVSGIMDDSYSIYIDVEYLDGSHLYGQTVQFSAGTHDWEYKDAIISTFKPVKSLNVTLLFREHYGCVWFDEVTVGIAKSSKDKLSNQLYLYNCTAGVFGDPIFSTFFNEQYSFQTPGDFTLLQSTGINIQTRHKKIYGNQNGTLISDVGIQLLDTYNPDNTHIVSFQFDTANIWSEEDPLSDYHNSVKIYLDGNLRVINDQEGALFIPSLGVITKTNSTSWVPVNNNDGTYSYSFDSLAWYYRIKLSRGEIIIDVHFLLDEKFGKVFAGYFRVFTLFSPSVCENVTGLLGTTTTLESSRSTTYTIDLSTASQSEINEVGNSWRLESKSTSNIFFTPPIASYYDPSFPASDYSLNFTSDTKIQNAVATCNRQFLSKFADLCEMDILLTDNLYIAQDYHSSERYLHLSTEPLQLTVAETDDVWINPVVEVSHNYGTIVLGSIIVLIAVAVVITIFRCRKSAPKPSNRSLINDDEEDYYPSSRND